MIRIYKNNDIKLVTKGAYEKFYKPLGYNLIVEEVINNTNVEIFISEDVTPTTNQPEQKTTKRQSRVSSNRKSKKTEVE